MELIWADFSQYLFSGLTNVAMLIERIGLRPARSDNHMVQVFLTIGLLESLSAGYLSSVYMYVVVFVIFVLFVRPSGLFGKEYWEKV
jgi:branched-subunit amino acid ABC-type transport system permease component